MFESLYSKLVAAEQSNKSIQIHYGQEFSSVIHLTASCPYGKLDDNHILDQWTNSKHTYLLVTNSKSFVFETLSVKTSKDVIPSVAMMYKFIL